MHLSLFWCTIVASHLYLQMKEYLADPSKFAVAATAAPAAAAEKKEEAKVSNLGLGRIG